MKTALKIIKYIAVRLLVLAVILGVLFAAFLSSMNTTNVWLLLTDGMKKRADVILLQQDVSTMSKYFTTRFIDTDSYDQLQQEYDNYSISNYGYKLNVKSFFVWPWETTTTAIVQEAVYSIDGALDTAKLSKDEAIRLNKLNPPDWVNAVYRARLINENGTWRIDDLEKIGDFDFELTPLRTLSPEQEAALNNTTPPAATPPPAVSATPYPVLDVQGTVVAQGTATVNVRSGPSTTYESIAELKDGDKVHIISEDNAWYKIQLSGDETGYVSKMYIALD